MYLLSYLPVPILRGANALLRDSGVDLFNQFATHVTVYF